jgi:hypothetical protein
MAQVHSDKTHERQLLLFITTLSCLPIHIPNFIPTALTIYPNVSAVAHEILLNSGKQR